MRLALAAMIAAIAALAAPARAAPPMELAGYVERETVTTGASGEPVVERAAPQVVVPGDRLIFGTRFTNTGSAPVEDFVVSNPVPPSVAVTGEIDPAQTVSVDGGKTWGRIAALTVPDSQGDPRPATPADITHMRWTIPVVAPGASGRVEFPVTVR